MTDALADQGALLRPKSREKRDRILSAGTTVFLDRGFEGASIDQIAAVANVSKQTIYNHFGDKASLFRTICATISGNVVASLGQHTRREADADQHSVKTRLVDVGRAYLDAVLAPSSLALHRIIIGETTRFPDLGPSVYAAGGARSIATLAEWLEARARDGELRIGDATAAAGDFYALVRGHRQVRALLGLPVEAEGAAREAAVERAVETFLRAYAA